jgi:hypothetical protein
MRPRGHASSGKPGQPGRGSVNELVQLVIAYAKQETVDPVRRQVRHLGRGLGGALLLAVGSVLLAVGFLRALQVEFGGGGHSPDVFGAGAHLSGNFSWVPYMGAALFCLAVSAGCVMLVVRRRRR